MAVVHHHVHPYPEQIVLDASGAHSYDASTVRDAGLFERFLEKHYFDVVLHGHKHKPQLRETRVQDGMTSVDPMKSLIVCGAGSCSVDPHELEHAVPNHYQVIELLSESRQSGGEFLKVEWRELAVTPGSGPRDAFGPFWGRLFTPIKSRNAFAGEADMVGSGE